MAREMMDSPDNPRELLEDDLRLAAERDEVVGRQVGDVLAVNADVASIGNEQAQAPATFSAAPTADNPTQVQLTSSTPRLATSGPISVVNPSGAVSRQSPDQRVS